jgi:4'-phosphopantetheinyl transferase EntD
VATACGRVPDHQATPTGVEAALAGRMAPERRAQFIAGRTLARLALARLGFAATALPRAGSGAPLWPRGCVGSITHCGAGADAWCGVVVARTLDRRALGLDAEPDEPLAPGLLPRVLGPADRMADDGGDGVLAKLVFSAKESVYKALHPLTGHPLDFHDVGVALDHRRRTFAARVLRDDWPSGAPSVVAGRWHRADGLILTAVEIAGERG